MPRPPPEAEREEAALLCEKRPQDNVRPDRFPGRLMQSFLASPANSYYPNRIHPALTSFADECCGMLARLIAYVGTLALLAIVGVHLWDRLPEIADADTVRAGGLERWPRARTRRLPSARPICPIKQSLMRFSGIPKAAARMSSAGVPPGCGRRRARNLSFRRGTGPIGTRHGRPRRAHGRQRPVRSRGRRCHRQQIRPCDAAPPRRTARVPASASSSGSTNPACRSPAGPARARPCRRGAPRSPAC